MKISFLGDIHGNWGVLREVLRRHRDNRIVQVGDMGLGFPLVSQGVGVDGEPKTFRREADPLELPERFSFIAGNHDNPETCRVHPNFRGAFGFDKVTGIFHLSGGYSIDKAHRTEGVDWWREEELSIGQLNEALCLYEKVQPRFVVSHEPPTSIHERLVNPNSGEGSSRTSQALEAMFSMYKPKRWIFGHHHKVWQQVVDGTEFVCVAVNQVKTFDF